MPKIILLRGNSGSGKSTVANALQKRVGHGTLLVSQDYVRREMLWLKSGSHNESIDLLKNLVVYGHQYCEVTILEGILGANTYERLFALVKELYAEQVYAYYYDLPFEETLRRHATKPIASIVGEAEMKIWWKEKDFLPNIEEQIIDMHMSIDKAVEQILENISEQSGSAAFTTQKGVDFPRG